MSSQLVSRFRGVGLFAFVLAVLAALAMLIISELSYRDAARTLEVLNQRIVAQAKVQSLWRDLSEAESGQRGYLLTGRAEYLDPYLKAADGVRRTLAWLQQHPPADAASAGLATEIDRLSTEKLSELATTLHLYQQGNNTRWHELLLSNIGQEKMNALRDLSNRLLDLDTAEIARDRDRVDRTLVLNRAGVAAMALLSLLALLMYLRRGVALDREREKQHELIQAQRDRLEAEVAARTTQLKELAQHLQTVREDERSRLARELHDELGALLTAAKLDAARLKLRLGTMAPEVAERLAHLNDALNSGIALKRNIIENLRPSSLGNLGLVAALEILVRNFRAEGGATVHCDLQPVRLTPSSELTVYRLVQEALTNIAKYAQASEVRVSLRPSDDKVRVQVADNGIGFEPERCTGPAHGLLGMRFRVDAEGGKFRLETAPGAGTRIEAWLPQAQADRTPEGASQELLSSNT
jgi:signal transduction histidine kinase